MRVEDLEVYKKLVELIIEVHHITMDFPGFERFEIGSQLRRSSNSVAANLAEGFGNKHTNVYTEAISRAQGEIRETKHHLLIARRKGYLLDEVYQWLHWKYEECSKMLFRLEQSLQAKKKK